jgi:hypothetical protein
MKRLLSKLNLHKWGPPILLAIFIVCLFIANHIDPNKFLKYSSSITIGVTTIYVYLTYEILRKTRAYRSIPHIDLEHILVSNLTSDYLQPFDNAINKNKTYIDLKQELNTEGARPKDIILVKLENLGKAVATNLEVTIRYDKRNLEEERKGLEKKICIANFRQDQKHIEIVEVFNSPSASDYFKINSCVAIFHDINGQQAHEASTKEIISKPFSFHRDETTSVGLLVS